MIVVEKRMFFRVESVTPRQVYASPALSHLSARRIMALYGKRPSTKPSPGRINPLRYAPDTTGAKRWARGSSAWASRRSGC